MTRRRRWPRSVRARTTLAATAVVVIALAAAAGGLLWLVSSRLQAAQRDSAVLRARDIAGLASAGQLPVSLSFPGEDTGVAQVVDQSGVVVAASPNLAGEGPITDRSPGPGRVRTQIRGGLPIGDESRFVVVALGTPSPSGPLTVYTAASLEAADQTLLSVTIALALGYPALLAIVALSARIAIGRTLGPVEAIRAEVADIGERDLHRRVPEPGTGDEIDRLADTMNTMLVRLDSSAQRQRRFVADASHELRSPIASLRTVLEVAAAHPETATLEATVDDALVDTARLEVLVVDLLTLARLDGDPRAARAGPVDLVAVCRTVLSGHPELTIEAYLPASAVAIADELIVRRAVTNLVDNAVRHAEARSSISIERIGGHYELHVDDDGDGVPVADRARIFERFTRLDGARARDEGGTGLGLAIVAELARSLGGVVNVTDSPMGGARFTLRIPAADPNGAAGGGLDVPALVPEADA